MTVTIAVGGFWGDEGKGKIVAYLAKRDRPALIARGGVGPNAGHTVEGKGFKEGLRMVPSGYVHKGARLLIGAGVLVNPALVVAEADRLGLRTRLGVDGNCGVIEERHVEAEKAEAHLVETIGSTKSGCGAANADRVYRRARLAREVPELKEFIADVPAELQRAIGRGRNVLLEGTQGFALSLYYGSYPYVTSKDTTAAQVAADVGVGPTQVDEVVVVFKAFPTRVGPGPFPSEMAEAEAEKMGLVEFGTVTGRRRRVGRWDPVLARRSCLLNGATQMAITGIDKVDPACRGARRWGDLTPKARAFVGRAERDAGVPAALISTGPALEETVDRRAKGRSGRKARGRR
jgi:adenylosuccinate synthase